MIATPRVLADFNAPVAAVVLKANNAAELVEANSTSVSVISPAHEYKILIWTFESFILFKLVFEKRRSCVKDGKRKTER